MSMKLIGSPASPYVRKVRVVLAEKKLDCQFVTENVWAEGTTIGSANPLGKVPCLIVDGQDAVFDSRVIVEHLDTLSPVGEHFPSILLIGLERSRLGREFRATALTIRSVDQCRPNRLRTRASGLLKQPQRPFCVVVEPH